MGTYTNTGRGPRGVWAKGGLIYLEPGETRDFVVEKGVKIPDDIKVGEGHTDDEGEDGEQLPVGNTAPATPPAPSEKQDPAVKSVPGPNDGATPVKPAPPAAK